ncbi:Kef-type K+ transport system membrane component KefB [Amycolatopsis lexingtonensis]|uniref:Kef-type K+ transport system membrane component KefB n=1 Tax=Amycolatopsis lexingtonensis TaxID=218822 RepID=A0ABR9I6F9_9PSEU|nr:cation:proton antiporter [Amycolatopsis lexingtonensis]MBE1498759.1 Kef-type K+ transport system membrane component KefB [Amycolatopsis lexingtonensis]
MSPTEAAPAFFLAVAAILVVCRLVCLVAVRLGQPPVVGEMISGVLLGPSLLGLVLPDVQTALFPDGIRPLLYVGGQIGLVIYMFGAGYEFSLRSIRGSAKSVGVISAAGTVVPLALGVGVAVFGTSWAGIAKDGVSLATSAAFVGVALAITAFPMLARIITERGLGGTRFGSLALACGALDDVLAWVLLAVVLGMHGDSAGPVALAVGGGLLFALLLVLVGRRVLAKAMGSERVSADQKMLITALTLFAAAWFTDIIGLYAVFGAFCVGIVFPRVPAADAVLAKIMPIGRIVFLPLFFTYSGLNTRFALLADPKLLLFAVLCVVVAIVGKLGACWGAARLVGEPQPIALRVGTLINARGLMQLIALNVGLAAGIVSPALFTVLVLVALVTTIMTAPVLAWLDRRDARKGSSEVLLTAEPVPVTGKS